MMFSSLERVRIVLLVVMLFGCWPLFAQPNQESFWLVYSHRGVGGAVAVSGQSHLSQKMLGGVALFGSDERSLFLVNFRPDEESYYPWLTKVDLKTGKELLDVKLRKTPVLWMYPMSQIMAGPSDGSVFYAHVGEGGYALVKCSAETGEEISESKLPTEIINPVLASAGEDLIVCSLFGSGVMSFSTKDELFRVISPEQGSLGGGGERVRQNVCYVENKGVLRWVEGGSVELLCGPDLAPLAAFEVTQLNRTIWSAVPARANEKDVLVLSLADGDASEIAIFNPATKGLFEVARLPFNVVSLGIADKAKSLVTALSAEGDFVVVDLVTGDLFPVHIPKIDGLVDVRFHTGIAVLPD
jgi:hypothetical protein